MTSSAYTREVGRKFYPDGTPRLFAGNTIICFVAPEHSISQATVAFQNALRQAAFGGKFALLPQSSFHMTVMELLCHEPQGLTPRGLSLARRLSRLRDVWLHDGSPTENTHVPSSDCISMTSAATLNACERSLRYPIRLGDVPAGWARTRGIAGVDQHHGDTYLPGLIGNVGLQLKE